MMQMVPSILDDWSGVQALAPEWNALLARSRANTIFLTWEWIAAWKETAGRGASPFVVSVRDSRGALAGVAPFYRTKLSLMNVLSFNALRILGDYPTGAEYGDWIVTEDGEAEVSAALGDALACASRAWDCIWMPKVSGWTGASDAITRTCRDTRLLSRSRPKGFAYTALPDSAEQYRKSLSSNKRQQLRSELKRINARESVRLLRCTTQEELPRFLDALFDLHHKRRRLLGDEGSFLRKPEEADFYRRFAPVALERNWLWLYGLEDAGELRAVQLGYVYGGVFHQMQEGFDPEYVKGAGNVLRAHVIDECIAAGVRGVDFLANMSEHKRRWLAEPRVGADLFIASPKLKNRLLFAGPIWPKGQTLRPVRSIS
jgi:CelD/BcsL family acetyltransferase involved in cellulose biosynthesis